MILKYTLPVFWGNDIVSYTSGEMPSEKLNEFISAACRAISCGDNSQLRDIMLELKMVDPGLISNSYPHVMLKKLSH